ncbi:N-terminal methionine N(alpha)-acetyltransferase NatF [Sarracenia purpurea var. burkii]
MEGMKGAHCPTIRYRPIRPSDLEVLEKIHCDLFPIRYESEFFHNVVNGHGIVSWGAVDRSRLNGQNDELIGFVTARVVLAKESDIEDLLRFDPTRSDQTLVYILTLGVVESYRNFGIATSLIGEVVKYASTIPTRLAVYLHVISYNYPAIHFYQKMSFHCVRRLHGFYFINGQHYDSFLFIYYLNGARSPCSLLELVTLIATYVRSGLKLVAARLWKNERKKVSRWPNSKETSCFVKATQSKGILMNEGTRFQCL